MVTDSVDPNPDKIHSARSVEANGQRLEAVKDDGSSPDYYGRLFWYTFSKMTVPQDELRELYKKLGIPEKHIPRKISAKGAWKRAITNVAKRESNKPVKDEDENGVTLQYEVRRFTPSIRVIEKTWLNSNNEQIDHEELVRLSYGGPDTIVWTPLESDADTAKEFYVKVKEEYKLLKNNYTNNKIRNWIRKSINRLDPIQLRESGGVYFVPERHSELMEKFCKLSKILDKKYSTGTTELVQIPVIKAPQEKEMIKERVRIDTVERASKKISMAKQILSENKNITPSQYQKFVEELKSLRQRKDEYSELLNTPLDICDEQIKILKQQMSDLASVVKGDS